MENSTRAVEKLLEPIREISKFARNKNNTHKLIIEKAVENQMPLI